MIDLLSRIQGAGPARGQPRVTVVAGTAAAMWSAGVGLFVPTVVVLLAWATTPTAGSDAADAIRAAGSAGPGRMAEVGPSAWQVGLAVAVEVGLVAAVASAVLRRRLTGA